MPASSEDIAVEHHEHKEAACPDETVPWEYSRVGEVASDKENHLARLQASSLNPHQQNCTFDPSDFDDLLTMPPSAAASQPAKERVDCPDDDMPCGLDVHEGDPVRVDALTSAGVGSLVSDSPPASPSNVCSASSVCSGIGLACNGTSHLCLFISLLLLFSFLSLLCRCCCCCCCCLWCLCSSHRFRLG